MKHSLIQPRRISCLTSMRSKMASTFASTAAVGLAALAALACTPADGTGTGTGSYMLDGQNGQNDPDDPSIQTMNGLSFYALTSNALTVNNTAKQLMVSQPLTGATYSAGYLATQLRDPFARELMGYVVYCALPVGASVEVPGSTWHGKLGMCEEWGDPVTGMASTACQERVSSCLLALENAYDVEVPISMRGTVGATPLPLQAAVQGSMLPDTASWTTCKEPAIEPADASRDCGWTVNQVGLCQASGIIAASNRLGTDEVMIRVCSGPSACDSADALQPGFMLPNGTTFFNCDAGKSFTMMTAPKNPLAALPPAHGIDLPAIVDYPASEAEVFGWEEGAFFGTIFAASSDANALQIEVDGATNSVVYHYNGITYSWPLTIVRRRIHSSFMGVSGYQGRVYERMFSCSSSNWLDPVAQSLKRVCAGPDGHELCAAKPIGLCGPAGDPAARCALKDVAGDGDYDDCTDPSTAPTTWTNPLTIYLFDSCSLVPESCAPASSI